jgi:hypothetical protein
VSCVESPRVQLVTSLGTVEVVFNDANNAWIHTPSKEQPLLVRRSPWPLSMYVERLFGQFVVRRHREGERITEHADWRAMTMSRWNGVKHEDASVAARKLVVEVLLTALNDYVAAHPDITARAALADLDNSIARVEDDIADLEEKLAERREALAVLQLERNAKGGAQ